MMIRNWKMMVVFVFLGLLGEAFGNVNAKLRILPEYPDGVMSLPLGESAIFTCVADVELPEKISDFKWYWPDGQEIMPMDSREEYERVEIIRDKLGTLTLLFNSLLEQDLGSYRCTATYALNQQMSANFTLRTFVPITFEDAPEYQYAVKGSDYKVKCRVKANPEPQVDWKKDHAPLQDSEHIVVDKDGLVIRDVQESDEGVYTCRVRVVQLGKVQERHIKVEVQEKPVIISDPMELEGVESESVVFACKAKGKPAAEYEWVNHRHQDLSMLERHTVDKYKGTLQIDGLKPEDSGTYRCTAKNTAGFDTSTSRLFVVTKPVFEEFRNVTSQVGGSATLVCRAYGDPAPDIVFHKDSERDPYTPQGSQRDTRIFTDLRKDGRFSEARLKIADLIRTDDGLYKCIAYTRRTRTELTGHLTVEYPPTFVNTPMKEAWSWDSQPVNLTCLAEGIPNATITWFVIDQSGEIAVSPITPNMRVIGHQSNSSLEIRPIHLAMYRFYKCVATNKLGTAEHRVHLREARRPGSILQAIVHEKTATSISFRIIGPMDDGGLPIKAFVVQYKSDRVGWEDYQLKSWPTEEQIFTVEGLEPLRTYYFRFAAENEVGIGPWAHERPETMPRRSAPEPPIIISESYNGIASSPYPDRFELRWTVPQDNGERIEAFEISYVPVRNYTLPKGTIEISEWDPIGQVLEEQKALGEPRHLLRNLFPGTFYKVEIRARNVIGTSQPAELIVKTSPIVGAAVLCAPPSSSYDLMRGESFQSLPMLIVIIAVILLFVLLFVDLICCRINQMGLFWAISHSLCNRKKSRESLVKPSADAAVHEKQPLADETNGYRQHSRIIAPEGLKANGNNRNGQPKDSEV